MIKILSAFSGFSVPDIAQAKQFYKEVLGLEVNEQPEGLEVKAAGAAAIFIYPSPTNKPATYTVLNFIIRDIDIAVDELVGKGVVMEQYDMPQLKTDSKGVVRNDGSHPGPKAIAWFKDPTGNILSVIQQK
jgi:catechol 2,3-dioxygenase-like lactoylglutathione lyase family enzyme